MTFSGESFTLPPVSWYKEASQESGTLAHSCQKAVGFFPKIWVRVRVLHPWRIHGTFGIFTDPWMVDFYGFHVGKYTSPMDPMGHDS